MPLVFIVGAFAIAGILELRARANATAPAMSLPPPQAPTGAGDVATGTIPNPPVGHSGEPTEIEMPPMIIQTAKQPTATAARIMGAAVYHGATEQEIGDSVLKQNNSPAGGMIVT